MNPLAHFIRRCRRGRAAGRIGAVLALLGLLLAGSACDREPSYTAFRDAAAQSLADGLRSLFGAVVDGTLAAYDFQIQGSSSSGSTP